MNQDTFTYIVNNGIYNVNGQQAMAAGQQADGLSGKRIRAQDVVDLDRHGSEDLQPAQRQILYRQRLLRRWSTAAAKPNGLYKVGRAALSGMHIISKPVPQWFWTTFQNVL